MAAHERVHRRRHRRPASARPRQLSGHSWRHVREMQALSLAEAVHKITGLAAAHMGFDDRGLLKTGMAADLVLFDPNTVIDHATPEDSQALSSGIATVWVNGVEVWDGTAATGRVQVMSSSKIRRLMREHDIHRVGPTSEPPIAGESK